MAISALILAILVAAGVVFDKLTYEEEKRNTYNRLKGWLEKIRQARFPDIHKIAIESCHHFLYRSFNFRKKPLRAFLSLIFVSWLLTTVFFWVGAIFLPEGQEISASYWHDYLPWYPIYLVNLNSPPKRRPCFNKIKRQKRRSCKNSRFGTDLF
ncbi:MAG: hypothetical protein H6575_11090 [Lewinellaceae bacterium]|nr:hypothetical protein [Lewinellaceae bacterium]